MVQFFQASKALLILLSISFAMGVASAQERGPLLRVLLSKLPTQQYTASVGEVPSLYPEPVVSVILKREGKPILSFDYVQVDNTEWFINLTSGDWLETDKILDQVMLPKKPTRSQVYFVKQLEITLSAGKPLSLAVESLDESTISSAKALLSRHEPLPGEQVAFFPPFPISYPTLLAPGREDQFWPLIIMELMNYATSTTFQYHNYLAPLSQGRFSGELAWINTGGLEKSPEAQESLILNVEIRPASVQIYRHVEVPETDKTMLEFEAGSNYIATFAGWFVPLWQALYPRARSLRVKKNAKSSLSVAVDLAPYKGMSCAPFLSLKK